MRHVVIWWALLEALGLISLPLTFRLFSAQSGFGYPFGKILTLLLLTYVSWVITYAGLGPFHIILPATLGVLVAVSVWRAFATRAALAAWWRNGGARALLRADALWTAGFLFFVWQRALAPDIFGAEKYMDFTFLNTLTRTEVFPPQDAWMSGKLLNYYYFGYLAFANLVRLSGVPNHIAYNLCVATVGGLGFSEFAAIGWRLTANLPMAILAGLNTMVLGNLDGFLQFLERRSLTPIDYWRSSRVVAKGDTINEFPFFSTIHGDLHPHFMVLPVTGLLLAVLLDRSLFPKRDDLRVDTFARLLPLAVVSFVLGAMVVISTWELPVAALLVFLLLGRDLPFWPLVNRARLQLIGQILGILVAAYLIFLPFYINFRPPTGGGVGFKVAQTALGEFLTVFGQLLFPLAILAVMQLRRILGASPEWRHLIIALGALVVVGATVAGNAVIPLLVLIGLALFALNYRSDDDAWRAPLNLAVVALIALLVCEFVFLRDSYGEKLYRMNTVFKLYFQAWLLLSVAAPWALAVLLRQAWDWKPAPHVITAAAGSLILASCAYPLGLTATRLGSGWPAILDGTAYIEREHPDDFAAIKWLRENVHGLPVILEASGDPYSYYARFSSNTGLPTVMGWANHEGLWRGDHQFVDARRRDVKQIYEAPSLDTAVALLDQYQVKYVIVGELERKDYRSSGMEKFADLTVAFRQGTTTIYQR